MCACSIYGQEAVDSVACICTKSKRQFAAAPLSCDGSECQTAEA
jgi:hypothetical protein